MIGVTVLLTVLSTCACGRHGAVKQAYPDLSAGWQWTNKISLVTVGWSQNSSLSTFTGHAQNKGTRWPSSWHTDEVVLGKLEYSKLQPP